MFLWCQVGDVNGASRSWARSALIGPSLLCSLTGAEDMREEAEREQEEAHASLQQNGA
jgi:hypothetical protein